MRFLCELEKAAAECSSVSLRLRRLLAREMRKPCKYYTIYRAEYLSQCCLGTSVHMIVSIKMVKGGGGGGQGCLYKIDSGFRAVVICPSHYKVSYW